MDEIRHTMKEYVVQTPEQVLNNIAHSKEITRQLVDYYCCRNFKRIVIVACGSSYNGSLCGKEFLAKVLKKEVKLVTPFTFVHYENDVTEDDFVIVVSQSGRSTNSLEAIEKIRERGVKVIGITSDIHSDFEDVCDIVVDWGVGIEKIGFVTKGVVTLALFFMLFAVEAALATGIIDENKALYWKDEMRLAMKAHQQLQDSSEKFISKHKRDLAGLKNVWTVSAGSNLATATEAALKISETVHVHTAVFEIEEFLHGPCYPLDPNCTIIFIDSNDECSERIWQVYNAAKEVSDHVFIISNGNYDDDNAITTDISLNEMVQPLAYLSVCPLLAEYASNELRVVSHPIFMEFKNRVQTKSDKKPRVY